MKIELFYHCNGRVCAVIKEEHKQALASRGWRPFPFTGVRYPNTALFSNWNMPWFGKWALELPKSFVSVEKPKPEPKKEEPAEDRSKIIPPTKKRGRPKKKE